MPSAETATAMTSPMMRLAPPPASSVPTPPPPANEAGAGDKDDGASEDEDGAGDKGDAAGVRAGARAGVRAAHAAFRGEGKDEDGGSRGRAAPVQAARTGTRTRTAPPAMRWFKWR